MTNQLSTRDNNTLEVDDGLSDRQVTLHGPRQVEQLRGYELEDLVDIDVVGRAREEERGVEGLRVRPSLRNITKAKIP